jgi:hypothetical protein
MPQPIAYNTGSQTSGSLKLNGIEYAISSSIVSGSNGQRWFTSVNPGNGIVLVTNSFTQSYSTYQNSTPLFYTASALTDAAITGAINGLPDRFGQVPFTTTASAFAWVADSRKYFMMNYEYPQIVTDGLVYLVDSTFLASYPQNDTTTSPIQNTAQVGVGTLQNGTAWAFGPRTFDFDGVDDQILINTSDNFNNINWSGGITVMVLYKIDAVTDLNSSFRAFIGINGAPANRSFNYYLYGASNPATTLQYHFSAGYSGGLSNSLTIGADKYHLAIFTCNSSNAIYWHNGQSVGTQGAGTPAYYTAGGPQYLGRADNFFKGNIARWAIYNKALSQSEILQNYYQGPIVTDGLVFAVDAGNLVSYESGSTITYSLTGSASGSLINGTGYSNTNGGTWNFDGVDDYIDTGKTATQLGFYDANYTMEAWVYPTDLSSDRTMFGTDQAAVRQGLHLVFRNGIIYQGHYGSDFQAGTVTVNNWYQIVYTFNASNGACQIFKNGVSQGTGTISSFIGTTNVLISRWAGIYYFQGPGGIYRIYNRVLSAGEVQQNFQAQRSRFGL